MQTERLSDKEKSGLAWLAKPDRVRSLYETAHPYNRKIGSGFFAIDWSDGQTPTFNRHEIDRLVRLGWIVRKWPDCEMYVLSSRAGEQSIY